MTTPRSITESVPDSIRSREAANEPIIIAHIVQRDRVRASIVAVPDHRRSAGTTHTPALVYPTA
jgi:hypothetical protein